MKQKDHIVSGGYIYIYILYDGRVLTQCLFIGSNLGYCRHFYTLCFAIVNVIFRQVFPFPHQCEYGERYEAECGRKSTDHHQSVRPAELVDVKPRHPRSVLPNHHSKDDHRDRQTQNCNKQNRHGMNVSLSLALYMSMATAYYRHDTLTLNTL